MRDTLRLPARGVAPLHTLSSVTLPVTHITLWGLPKVCIYSTKTFALEAKKVPPQRDGTPMYVPAVPPNLPVEPDRSIAITVRTAQP